MKIVIFEQKLFVIQINFFHKFCIKYKGQLGIVNQAELGRKDRKKRVSGLNKTKRFIKRIRNFFIWNIENYCKYLADS